MRQFLVFFWAMSAVLFALEATSPEIKAAGEGVRLDSSIRIESGAKLLEQTTTYTHKPLFECSPSIDAYYKIISQTQILLLPQKPLTPSTLYSCKSNPQYLTQGGYFEYQSADFDVVDIGCSQSGNLVTVEFNAPIDTQNALKSIEINKLSNLSKSKLNYTLVAQDQNRLVLKLNEDAGYRLEVKIFDTLTSLSGSSLTQEIIKVLSKDGIESQVELDANVKAMQILDKPRVVALDEGKFALRLYFDDTIERENLKRFLKVLELEDYTIGEWQYIYYDDREEGNVSSSYFIDIKSDDIKPNQSYGVVYNKGLKHYQELKESVSYRIESGDMKSSISFGEDKPYLSNIGEIGFTSVNIDKATLIIEQVTTDNYRYFVNYNQLDRDKVSDYTQEIFSKEVVLNNPKNEPTLHKFSVKDLIGTLSSGVYKITLNYEERVSKDKTKEQSKSKVLFVSDIAIGANIAANQAFISLVSLSDAAPIEGANVQLYSKNNTLIAQTTSNSEGVAKIDKEGLLQENPNMIIVTKGEDQNFLLLKESNNALTFEDVTKKEEPYKAYVYAQSEIIRPASTLNTLIVIKDRDFVSANSIPIKVEIFSVEDYKTIFSKIYNTNALGLVDFNFTFEQTQTTGSYRIDVYLGDVRIGSQLIAVEAFIPPKIENRITLNKESYFSNEFIEAKIASNYLFGMPSSNLNGTVSFEATHKPYTHLKYPNFSFSNEELVASNELNYITQTDTIELDENGTTTLLIGTKPTQKVPSILKGVIGAKILDDTQPVSTYKEVTIYPYKAMMGVALDHTRIERGGSVEISPLLIDPLTSELVNRNVVLNIKKLTWHYRYLDGYYKWDKEVELVTSKLIASNEKFVQNMNDYGDYIIEIVDTLGGHSATQYFDVWGWDYASLSPKNDLKSVEVEFEDREYAKGDIVSATIKSPILEGYMVVTLEKDRVLWHKALRIEKGVAKVEIPIEEYLGRGAYLHTTVVRKSDTSSKILPYRASSYDFVKSNRNQHNINVALSMAPLTKSHTSNTLTITTDREATLLVSVVDVGILNMVAQEIPKIFDFFNDKALQRIVYFDIYEQVMSYLVKGSFLAFGSDGDAEDMKKKKHLPPKVERVKPFMLWSKLIQTNANKATYTIDVPQFNGRSRIVVIATTADAIGVASQEFVVRDDIIIKPSYPRFMLVGDSVELPIRIFNNTENETSIVLERYTTPHIAIELPSNKFTIPPKSSKVVSAKLLAYKEGIAKASLSLDDGKAKYTHEVEFGIMSPHTLSTMAFKGSTTTPITLTIPDSYRNAQGFVYLSDNPLGVMRNDIKYLIDYPYGCVEQTSSKLNAMLYAQNYLKDDKLLRNAQKFITKGIDRVVGMQQNTGLFSYWGDVYVDDYASIYAAQTLLELHGRGYLLKQEVMDKIYMGLKSIVEQKYGTTYLNRHRIYAAFVLAQHNQLELSSANMLYDNKMYEDYYISWYYLSAIYQKLGMADVSQKLYEKVQVIRLRDFKEQNFSKVYGGYTTMSRDMALVLYLNSAYFDKNTADFDTMQQRLDKLYSTHEKAMALKAIDAYLEGKGSQKMNVNVNVDNQSKLYTKPTAIEIENLQSNHLKIEPISGVANYSVEIYKHLPQEIKNRLYPIQSINIKRDFVDAGGKIVDFFNLKQGDRVYSKLTIANETELQNMLINHRIPACMEIDNMRLGKNINAKFKNENITLTKSDIRDDRVLYFANLPAPTPDNNQGSIPMNYATLYTPLVITTKGECQLPAIVIEAMYDSRISDYVKESDSVRVK